MEIKVDTKIFEGGVIEQVTAVTEGDEIRKEIMRQVVATQDEHVKKALIHMGWTPPVQCNICQRPMDLPTDPSSKNMGGDCAECMAEVGDPAAIELMEASRGG